MVPARPAMPEPARNLQGLEGASAGPEACELERRLVINFGKNLAGHSERQRDRCRSTESLAQNIEQRQYDRKSDEIRRGYGICERADVLRYRDDECAGVLTKKHVNKD